MIRQIQTKFLRQTRREYQPRQRLLAMAFEGIFFLVLFPYALFRLGTTLDQWIGWPILLYPPVNAVVGGLVMLGGWLFALWTIYVQFTIGRGTPVPLMATQKLIVQPPYSYCRNPMVLGTIGFYTGMAVVFGSLGALLLVLASAGLLLLYVWRVEEQEMVLRFGQEYLEYKERTPFLIPRL